jgi:hypothetical protein
MTHIYSFKETYQFKTYNTNIFPTFASGIKLQQE